MTINFQNRFSALRGTTALTRPLFLLGTASALFSTQAQAFDANSLPQGATVTGGSATVAASGNTLTVNQSSNRAIIDWRSFDIGANAQANFNQPGSGSIAVNRVNGTTDPSRIDGSLHANGQVWILNPNGVMFGKTARVDAAGVVATTANIDDKAFMAGSNRLQMTGGDSGQVVNEGHVTVGQGGLAAFVAPSVRNSGVIRARVGKITLAAGDTYTLDLAGDRLVELGLGAGKAVVDQSGKIVNPGGVIDISAKAAGQVVDSLINVSGVTSASSAKVAGGQIILGGDDINVASTAKTSADGTSGGQITAVANKTGNYAGSYSAQGTTGDGGQIETSGKTVHIDSQIAVNTKSARGKTGNWTLDPDTLTVQAGSGGSVSDTSQSTVGADTVVAALNTTDVTLQAKTAITVNSAIDASGNANAHNLALVDQDSDGHLTVNLNAAIRLKSGGVLSGQADIINLTNGALVQNANDVALANAAIHLGAGSYAAGATLNKSGLTLAGSTGAVINVGAGQTGLTIGANNITVENLEIGGPLSGAYTTLDWTSQPNSWAIQVTSAATTGFNITGNNIHDVRTGILLANSGNPASGAASGAITGNLFNNTKGAVIDQYRDGSTLTISGNSQGATGNEWGVVYNTNLNISNTGNASNPSIYADAADSTRQAFLLGVANLNNGLTVLDRGYTNANRTAVTVDAAASGTPDNGFGNARQPLSTITAGLAAVVAGGTVNVHAGTYAESLNIAKAVDIEGAANGGTIIAPTALLDTHTGHKYDADVKAAVFVHDASNIILNHLTITGNNLGANAVVFWNNASGTIKNSDISSPMAFSGAQTGQGLAVDATGSNTVNLTVDNVSFHDWNKNGIDAVTGDGAGTNGGTINLMVDNSTFTGRGATGTNAQNGILGWERGGGTINLTADNSTFQNIAYTGNDAEAAGVLLYGSPNATVAVTGSHFNNNQVGIAEDASQVHSLAVSGNSFSGNDTHFEGMDNSELTGVLDNNTFDRTVANAAGGNAIYGDLQTAIDSEAAGSTLNLAGIFAAGTNINRAGDTLDGQGKTVIKALNNGDNGLTISANNVTVKNLEIAGPATGSYDTYAWGSDITRGIVVARNVTGFAITGNNIHGTRNDILVDGLGNTGAITGNTIAGSKSGISVQYTDGSGIAISGNTDGGNANEWGINLHLNGHSSDGVTFFSNSQKIATDADAAAQAVIIAFSNANGGWTVQDQGYTNANRTAVTVSTTGSDANQGSGLNSLATIQAGMNAVVAGGTVNIKDGTYVIASGGGNYLDITKSLTLKGQSEAGTIIDASNASTYGLRVQADNVELSDFTLKGPAGSGGYGIKVEPLENIITPNDRVHDFSIANVTETGSYKNGLDLNGVLGASIDHVTVSNTSHGTGIAITDSANITLTNDTTSGNAWGGLALYQHNATYNQQTANIVVDASNTFNEANPVYAEDQSATNDFGSITLAGFDYVVKSPNDPNDVYSWFQKTRQGAVNFATDASLNGGNLSLATATVQGYAGSGAAGNNHFTVGIGANGSAMSVNAALDQSAAGGIIDVLSGTYAEVVSVAAPRTLNFDNADLNGLTIAAGGAGTALSGSLKTGSVIALGDVVLGGDLSIDTTGDNGAISLANVDGAHDLTLNAGSGVARATGFGAATRLGAVDITASAIFLGATNKGASFTFNGDVTLSAASTVINTMVSNAAAGAITFSGNIFGTADGAQSLTLSAGPGTGNKSANGDIVLNNAGLSSLRLGSLTVSGNNFTALTVDLAGDFTSTLTGNQVFAADTLNAGGNVNSQVAGDATGHIVSSGDINMKAGGDVSGTISGTNVDLTAGSSVSGTISATNNVNLGAGKTVSGTVTGQTVSLTGQSVNTQVNAKTLNVNAPSGTVTGTFTLGTASDGLSVNGQVTGSNTGTGGNSGGGTGSSPLYVNGQQLVVENFVLPAGTQVAANGQLILPAGTVLGLLSPGGGPARVVMVDDVRTLGQLLSEGYVAFVVDLKAKKKAPVRVASN